jgi:hypothetical protein
MKMVGEGVGRQAGTGCDGTLQSKLSTFSSIKINAFLNPFFISLFLQWLRHHLKNRKKPHKKRGWNHLSFLRLINAK